jgi:hypothetical protein
MCLLYLLAGIIIGFLLSTAIGYSQTYSKDNLSLYLDKQHQSIDTTQQNVQQPKYINLPEEYDLATPNDRLICFKKGDTLVVQFNNKPKTQHIMTFQVTILDYKPNKWFYLLLICIDQPMDSLKIHTFQGSELYNNLLFMCETIYGYYDIVGDDYIGTLDEELFLLRGDIVCKQAPSMKLNIGE